MENQNLPKALVGAVVVLLIFFAFGSRMYTNIAPGHKGVMFYTFGDGLDKETVYGQGIHFFLPWNEMIVYDVKETEVFEKMEVLSKNIKNANFPFIISNYQFKDTIIDKKTLKYKNCLTVSIVLISSPHLSP